MRRPPADPIATELAALRKELADALDLLAKKDEELARLRDFIADFAAAKIEALRYSSPHGSSPEDEPDPVVDANKVWAWQEDARAALTPAPHAGNGEGGAG